ncbi:hypothetical protein JCM10914A_35750 [Paenibacillus sp. JCM 10914]|uniref:hypothetical protein n=1 Tax=Paenibacillus sp. JCM 10914 TaxID=1236974 RepID=UPI0003CC3003|nr:hypothetical protein [Paenibacillus sp. JCM 10914]GAE04223.1 hypothetical protein JCM10914_260 [Paenibacillus sp. JCM 10914]
MSSRKDLALGIFIVVAGVVIFLGKLGVFGFLGRTLWPLVLLLPGILLHLLFFARRASAAILIPAGILTVYGLLFFICNFAGWGLMAVLWPVLMLGIAVGMYEYYVFETPRPAAALPIALGLTLLSVPIFIFSWLSTGAFYIIALILIAAGIWIIFGRNRSKRQNKWSRGW